MFRRNGYYSSTRGTNLIVVFLYLIIAAYFINYPFGFVKLPEIISTYDKWIIFVAGFLMIFGAINYFKARRI